MSRVMVERLTSEQTPDFTQPLALLRACHERMLGQCQTLEKLVAHLRKNGADDDANTAAEGVCRYFTKAAPLHHQDEELDLFPLLQRQSLKLADLVYSLKQEHPQIEDAWSRLEPDLRRLNQMEDLDAFASKAADFCSRCRAHIKRENDELLTLAQHSLSSKQQQAMGEAMAERRGVKGT
jgi:hemerythrin-like domain-containing protein